MALLTVVVINGWARAGKDTLCEFAIQHLRDKGWRGFSISSIEPIRKMLRDAGVPVDLKRPAERDIMAEVKSALERYDWFATAMCARAVQDWFDAVPGAPSVCFAHMREAAAIRRFQTLFGPGVRTKTLFVDSPRAERITSNSADADVENLTYDLTVLNDGSLESLRVKSRVLADLLMEEMKIDDDFRADRPAFTQHGLA